MFRIPVGLNGIIDNDLETGIGSGQRWVRFRVKDIDERGVADRDAVFHNVNVRGAAAEAALNTFQRGDYVAVVGEQITRAVFDRGRRRQTVRVEAAVVAANPQFMAVGIDRRIPTPDAQINVTATATRDTDMSIA